MTASEGYTLKNPPHIGGFIREIIEAQGLTVKAAAAALGVSRPAIDAVLNERASLSGDMALRLEKAFGVTMDTLLRMQNAYDIAQARSRENSITVQPYVPKQADAAPQAKLL